MSADIKIWIANILVLFHAVIVGISVAGTIAIFTGRFRKFNKRDYFAISYFLFAIGQLLSLVFTGGCFLTDWERQLRESANQNTNLSDTFLQNYLPFLPDWFIESVPILTLASVVGAVAQIYLILKRKKVKDKNYDHQKRKNSSI